MSRLSQQDFEAHSCRIPAPGYIARFRQDLRWTPAQHIEILHRGTKKNADRRIAFLGYKNAYVENNQPGDSLLKAVFGGSDPGEVGHARNSHKAWQHFLFPTMAEIGTQPFAQNVNKLAGEIDVYVSMNSFLRYKGGRRCASNIADLSSLYADIDDVTEELGLSPAQAGALTLQICAEKGIPGPSYIMETGRGIHVVWLHDKVPYRRLVHWKHTIRKIKVALAELKPDAVTDAPRMMRLAGTVNGRPGTDRALCRPIFVNGTHPLFPKRYGFEQLWLTIAPPPTRKKAQKGEVFSISDASRAPDAPRDKDAPNRWVSFYSIVLSDIKKLIHSRYKSDQVTDTNRNNTLLAVMMCYAHTSHPLALNSLAQRELKAIGWNDDPNAVSYMQTVVTKASELVSGTGEWRFPSVPGAVFDPRYTPSAAWFINHLGISREEMTKLNLRALINKDRKREIDRIRKAEDRGQVTEPMDIHSRKRAERIRVLMSGREIHDYLTQNSKSSIRAAAGKLGISKTTAHRHLRAFSEATNEELSQLSHPVPNHSSRQRALNIKDSYIHKDSKDLGLSRAVERADRQVEHFECIVLTSALAERNADTARSVKKEANRTYPLEHGDPPSIGLAANRNCHPPSKGWEGTMSLSSRQFSGIGLAGDDAATFEWYRCPQYGAERLISARGAFYLPSEVCLDPEDLKALPLASKEIYHQACDRQYEETGEVELWYEACELVS